MNCDNIIINKPGHYVIPRLSYYIKVNVTPEHLVYYTVVDSENRSVIRSVNRFSATQRWHLFWDHDDRFWIQSSDIGSFVWQKTKQGQYKQNPVSDNEKLIKKMPDEIYDAMPNVMKRRWLKYRVGSKNSYTGKSDE